MHSETGIVLVVNRGAWVSDDIDVIDGMCQMMKFLREDIPRALLLFRSSSMAHENCDLYLKPRAKDEPLLSPSDGNEPPSWRWSFFPRQSSRIVQPIVAYSRLQTRGIFLDVFPAMQQRPDGHTKDCLHYCVPGPIDQWVRWIFGVLHEIERRGVLTEHLGLGPVAR